MDLRNANACQIAKTLSRNLLDPALKDINGDLVNLYRVVQKHLEEFVRPFKWVMSSRQVFEWLRTSSMGFPSLKMFAGRRYAETHFDPRGLR